MKTAVVYDTLGYFVAGKEEPDNYQLAGNETFLIPDSSLLKPRFNGTTWVGSTQTEFNQATINKDNINKDPSLEGMIQQLGLTIAQLSASQAKVEQQLTKLTNGGVTNA